MEYPLPEHHVKGQRGTHQCYYSLELMGVKKTEAGKVLDMITDITEFSIQPGRENKTTRQM